MPTFCFPWKPNATLQARPIARARHERRLWGVACKRLILIEAPSAAYRSGMVVVGEWFRRRGGDRRRCSTHQPQFSCGIDWHARTMDVCIRPQDGEIRLHRERTARPDTFLQALAPSRDGLVGAVAGRVTW